jgi:hypothetical protein
MALSDASIRNAKAGPKPVKLSDGGGLFLLLNPNGSRLWRLKYRFAGKEKLVAFGAYPTSHSRMPVKAAMTRADSLRRVTILEIIFGLAI